MQLLLDTHTLLWYAVGAERLSPRARTVITDLDNQVFVSVASLWEIAIKHSAGKLILPAPFDPYVAKLLDTLSITLLPISLTALNHLVALPFHHRDPFDRLLIAQAMADDLTLVSRDAVFTAYAVTVVW